MKLSDFDFYLPTELIAQHPLPERTASRLLQVQSGALIDRKFTDILELIEPGDILVFNDTRVMNARLWGKKDSGGKIEVVIERVLDQQRAYAHVRASNSPKIGQTLKLCDTFEAQVIRRQDDLFELQFTQNVFELLERYGQLPLPPYITHTPDAQDKERYQTVFAKHVGAIAAPTAGLHFDATLLAQLRQRGVQLTYITLHVGAGTFQPVRSENIAEHQMHSEYYEISHATAAIIERAKTEGRRIIAVGTTSLRALEAAMQKGQFMAGAAETKIFITPGYQFKMVDCLLTNFHLPKSTLLMLVSAFAGVEQIRNAYAHAIAQRYRFFSYGDAMFLERPIFNFTI